MSTSLDPKNAIFWEFVQIVLYRPTTYFSADHIQATNSLKLKFYINAFKTTIES